MNEPAKPSTIYGNAIWCHKPNDVPQQDHWAILRFERVTTPGYDKGDPNDSVQVCQYDAYLDRKDWEAAITKIEKEKYGRQEYVALKVSKPAKTTVKIEVSE